MSIVICRLPQAGLGNQLFPLMKAYVFADLNNLKVVVTDYNQINIGPYLRRERSKRNYRNYFVFQKSIIREQWDKLELIKYKKIPKQLEHSLEKISGEKPDSIYYYYRIPHWADYFTGIKDHRDRVISLFWGLLSPGVKLAVGKIDVPCIGIHIRRGDYRELRTGEDFRNAGITRTPLQYFLDIIIAIRTIAGKDLPVSIFTDGYKHELEQIFTLGNMKLVEGNTDIVDLLLLSKSKIIVTSAGSTFSSWAGFLSNAILIMHPDHIHQSIRPHSMASRIYEGAFDAQHPVLLNNIRSVC